MKQTGNSFGYAAAVALICGAMAVSAAPAFAGKGYGKDNNPGQANGHAGGNDVASNGNSHANMSASLGSLNSAHASAEGLAHANRQHSPVGMLASYMDAMIVYQTEYNMVDWTAYNDLQTQIADLNTQISDLNDQIAALDPTSATYESDKQDLENQIADLQSQISDLQTQADEMTAAVDAAATDAAGDLSGAANKDNLIDGDVVHTVNSLLDGKTSGFTDSGAIHDSEGDIANIINP